MEAVDTNILVYAHREDSPWHVAADRFVQEVAEAPVPWAIPWPCLYEFYAIVTHPKIYKPPTETEAVSAEDAEALGLARTPAVLVAGGQRYELDRDTVVLGRSRECDVTLDDANVSRRHAEITQDGRTYWIVDLGSTNGVEVNGKRVQRAKLEHEDEIRLGTSELRFERGF